jgi:hypothetical protein
MSALATFGLPWWGRRFRLPAGARPWPVFSRANQSRRDGILFNVPDCSRQVILTAQVVIIRLVLPKRQSGTTEDAVCISRGRAFEPSQEHGNLNSGQDQQVDVVWHYHPGIEFIKVATLRLRLQQSVRAYESVAGGAVSRRSGLFRRPRAPQAPPIVRMKVRQSSSIFGHVTGRRNRLPHHVSAFLRPFLSTKCANAMAERPLHA